MVMLAWLSSSASWLGCVAGLFRLSGLTRHSLYTRLTRLAGTAVPYGWPGFSERLARTYGPADFTDAWHGWPVLQVRRARLPGKAGPAAGPGWLAGWPGLPV